MKNSEKRDMYYNIVGKKWQRHDKASLIRIIRNNIVDMIVPVLEK